MNLFKRVREAAKRAAQAVQRAGRRVFNRKKPAPTVQEEVLKKYPKPKPSAWSSWKEAKEEALKAKDQEWRIRQQNEAYKKFNENYNMSRVDYDNMLDDIGGAMNELAMYVEGGSPTIVEMYKEYQKKFDGGTPGEFKDLMEFTKNTSPGINQEDLVNNMYSLLDAYEYYQGEMPGGDLQTFLDFVKDIKEDNPDLDADELRDRIYFEIDRDKE